MDLRFTVACRADQERETPPFADFSIIRYMSRLLLRIGLWMTLVGFALYIAQDAFPGSPFSRLLPEDVIGWLLVAGLAIVGGGIVIWILEFAGRKLFRKSFCIVCHTKIRYGDLYCRQHLRATVEQGEEHLRRQPPSAR